ncbi:hypothetical protein PMIN04_012949, partial [Paraphaeosphaeria minitans]
MSLPSSISHLVQSLLVASRGIAAMTMEALRRVTDPPPNSIRRGTPENLFGKVSVSRLPLSVQCRRLQMHGPNPKNRPGLAVNGYPEHTRSKVSAMLIPRNDKCYMPTR